ncbi:MAG: phosphogluconate dehydrogenase (NADP(+)-dependent, decarboxylating) [Phyllobacteriaceae bacterium]|nr:phosphogluconate dehydrogenase (NADP(+)-dependent, decarboxylating) [Phyllobacteriaceae bacterium]MBA93330.1 phosphogluconate dehydrogenase (NADP(+)-dependent, decarboxylating) [Phyllobacteriaceae bacterium]
MNENAEVGLIGLGTMGAALALNIAEKGHRIAVFNRTAARTDEFMAGAGALASLIVPSTGLEAFVASIARPRKFILMVPAGAPVDEQIAMLEPLLEEGDIIIDCGNANFADSNRRAALAETKPWRFLGVGVSGGEEGARHGPSIMAGGDRAVWDEVSPIFLAIAARHTDGTPCATFMGEGGAGHFVKMVHNGIEYADMQMIAEIYGLLRDGHGWNAGQVADLFARWNEGPLRSYLVEITAHVARASDPQSGAPLLDVIVDQAGQKGTGRWTVIEAQHLGTPVPVIEGAVAARNMSAAAGLRRAGEDRFGRAARSFPGAARTEELERALIAGKILCYAQGFAMLDRAAADYGWALPMADIARVWRAGCIIRSAMLDDMATALEERPENLVFAPRFADLLTGTADSLRAVVGAAVSNGHPVPSLGAGLAWFDQLRQARSTANLIQGQRDYFGRHGFHVQGREGVRHGPWADGEG